MGTTISQPTIVAITSDNQNVPLTSTIKKSQKVQLCSKEIKLVTPQVVQLNCTNLQLCCNQISQLPKEIGFLSKLTILSLYNNQLDYIPNQLYNLINLIELDLSGNRLIGLSKSISSLQRLNVLNLDTNRITELPQEIGRLRALETLQLSNNPIRALPAEMSRLKCLKTLTVQNCPLEPIPEVFSFQEASKVLSLKELSARVILQSKSIIKRDVGPELLAYLDSARTCSYCQGPFFETYHSRGRIMSRIEGSEFPLEYKLCSSHWCTNDERIRALFAPPPQTLQPLQKSIPRTFSFASLSTNQSHVGNLIRSFSTNSLKSRFLRRQQTLRVN